MDATMSSIYSDDHYSDSLQNRSKVFDLVHFLQFSINADDNSVMFAWLFVIPISLSFIVGARKRR